MPLNLDLSGSIAKLVRARAHIQTLKGETPGRLNQNKPYSIGVGEVDPAGWADVTIVVKPTLQHDLGVVVGDALHNLRCALDYIVSALVVASKQRVKSCHQFPIFGSKIEYCSKVGNAQFAVRKGPLSGVIYGLQQIWNWQPFNRNINPVEMDLLWMLNRLSNADKHRLLTHSIAVPTAVGGKIEHNGGPVVEEIKDPELPKLPNGDYKMGRIRFERPFPTKIHFDGNITVAVIFSTPAFGKDPSVRMTSLDGLEIMCERVGEVIEVFAKL